MSTFPTWDDVESVQNLILDLSKAEKLCLGDRSTPAFVVGVSQGETVALHNQALIMAALRLVLVNHAAQWGPQKGKLRREFETR